MHFKTFCDPLTFPLDQGWLSYQPQVQLPVFKFYKVNFKNELKYDFSILIINCIPSALYIVVDSPDVLVIALEQRRDSPPF